MLAPGTYTRRQHGVAEGRGGRVVVRDFFTDQRWVMQWERDAAWDATGVGPAYEGQAT